MQSIMCTDMRKLQDDVRKEYNTGVRRPTDKQRAKLPLATSVACLRFSSIFQVSANMHICILAIYTLHICKIQNTRLCLIMHNTMSKCRLHSFRIVDVL